MIVHSGSCPPIFRDQPVEAARQEVQMPREPREEAVERARHARAVEPPLREDVPRLLPCLRRIHWSSGFQPGGGGQNGGWSTGGSGGGDGIDRRRCRPWLPTGRRRPERRLASGRGRLGDERRQLLIRRALDAEAAGEQQEVESLLAHAQVDVEDGDEGGGGGRGDHAPDRRGEGVQDEPGDRVARRVGEGDPDHKARQRGADDRDEEVAHDCDAEVPHQRPCTSLRERQSELQDPAPSTSSTGTATVNATSK